MKALTILIITLGLALPARARLGDTEARVVGRYGKPVQVYRDVKGRAAHIHRSDGYVIMVQYLDGTSQSEVYAKEDDALLSDADIQKILSANANGEKWQELPAATAAKAAGPGWRCWVILRTRALSAYGPSVINNRQFQHAISVGTRAYNDQNKALSASAAATPSQPKTGNLPNDARTLYQLGSYYREKGEYEKAVSVLRKARDLDPKNYVFLDALSEAAESAGNLRDALDAHYQSILSLIPEARSASLWMRLARLAIKCNNDELRDLARSQVWANSPTSPKELLRFTRELREASNGPNDEVRKNYEMVLAVEPDNAEAQQGLKELTGSTPASK